MPPRAFVEPAGKPDGPLWRHAKRRKLHGKASSEATAPMLPERSEAKLKGEQQMLCFTTQACQSPDPFKNAGATSIMEHGELKEVVKWLEGKTPQQVVFDLLALGVCACSLHFVV
jgi:hypothetical protein